MDWSRNVDDDPFEEADVEITCNRDTKCWKSPLQYSPLYAKPSKPSVFVPRYDLQRKSVPSPKDITVVVSPISPKPTLSAKTAPTMALEPSNQIYTQTNDSRNQEVYQPPTLSSIPYSVRQTLTVQPYEKEIRKPVSESEIISMSVVESPVDSKTAQDCFMNYLKDLEGKIINLNKEKEELQLKLVEVNKALEGAKNGKCEAVAKLAVTDEANLRKAAKFVSNQANYLRIVGEKTLEQQN